jgi:hypothetical protein
LGGEKARELRLCLSNISIISFIVSYVIKDWLFYPNKTIKNGWHGGFK